MCGYVLLPDGRPGFQFSRTAKPTVPGRRLNVSKSPVTPSLAVSLHAMLTLNILLSFAQSEREVIGTRSPDKRWQGQRLARLADTT